MSKKSLLRLASLPLIVFLSIHAAQAGVFNIANGDIAALKNAITTANTNGESDTINLASNGTYTLTTADNFTSGANGLPVINNDAAGLDLTINGHDATIERNNGMGAPEFRILQIGDEAEVSCNDLKILHGKASGAFPAPAGGSIFIKHATLTLTHCAFFDNVAVTGGAIYNDSGLLNVSGTTFEQNIADAGPNGLDPARGGAITNIVGGVVLAGSILHANRSDREGGAIWSSGTARLTNSALAENVASGAGGGIANEGELTLTDCELDNNRSDNVGGGIHTTNTLALQRCTLTRNESNGFSGGGVNNFGTLTVESSSFLNNSAGSRGGAISTFGNDPAVPAHATVTNSVFSNNFGVRGGALSNFAAALTLVNSTVSGNTASVLGGAIHNINGIATVRAVTFTGNSAREDNAGIFNHRIPAQPGPSASLTIQDTIFQLGRTGVNLLNAGGTVISEGFNLSDDPASGDLSNGPGGLLNGPHDARNTDPRLGPLQDNGGSTLTHALLGGSPAIDAGSSVGVPQTDQRGFERGVAHDIGAFEFGGIAPAVPVASAVSRKLHGSTVFDINLPFTGARGVECRSGGAQGDFTIVFNFVNPLTLVGGIDVTSGVATIDSGTGINASDSHQYVVQLTGVSNAQVVILQLANVNDSLGNNSPTLQLPIGFLIGDTTGNGSVNASDVSQTKLRSGQAISEANFQSDLTVSGSINASDVSLVKSKSGTALP
jgi:hypothetical protein